MLLPTKHLRPEQSLLVLAAEVLAVIDRPMSVSAVWDRLSERARPFDIGFDWFVLALDTLFLIEAIDLDAVGRVVLAR